mmetsp:Transcript_25669/g.57696  ORF Transcript_25669/g.57696 Transcript_25669/m.57696 type:complete len:172 (+) Transcript_25669:3-518(+)
MGVGMGAGVGAGAPSSSARGATYTGTMGSIQVGEAVEVIGGDRLYTGVVTAIIDQTEYKVRYFEFPDPVSLPPSSLQRIPPSAGQLAPSEVAVGLRCTCKYSADQAWYEAVVTSVTAHGCIVTYSQYGNSEEVPLAYLRQPGKGAAGAVGAGAGGVGAGAGAGAGAGDAGM